MTVLRGRSVTLRPFREDEIERALERFPFPEADGNFARARRRERLAASGTRTRSELLFAIEGDSRVIGEIQARSPEEAMPPGVFELGIELYERAHRGRGFGSDAVATLTFHLFDEEAAIRVQASTDLENVPMRRTLERLGFGFEGVLRGFMPTTEDPRDHAMYGMTRQDWERVRDRWTRTS
jgi:[ribosomal protein S5]-alanine N-acetyltransferase